MTLQLSTIHIWGLYMIHWYKQIDCFRCYVIVTSTHTYIYIGLFQTIICTLICKHMCQSILFLFRCCLIFFTYSFVTLSTVFLSSVYLFYLSLIVLFLFIISFTQKSHKIFSANICLPSLFDEMYFILKTILLV